LSIALVLVLLVIGQTSATPAQAPAKMYLGPLPSKEGFIPANKQFDESYRDIREEYQKDRGFQQALRLVDRPDDADVVLEIVDRGLRDTGIRSGSGTVIGGTTVVGSSAPVRQKWLFARLVVPGTDYVIELDGHAGIKLVNYRQQARNLLRQAVEWVKANRPALAKAR
jgi:hypothetical protein